MTTAAFVGDTGVTRPTRSLAHMMRSVLKPVALFAVVVLFTRTVGEYGNSVVVAAGIAMIVATGLHVLVQWAGQISLGQIAFVGIGAFVTAGLDSRAGVPLPLAMVAGVAAATLASVAVGLPALRIRGFPLAITTLAFGFAAERWLFRQAWLSGESTGVGIDSRSLFGFEVQSSRELVIPVTVLVIAVVALAARIGSSAVGRGLRMMAADEQVAASYGVNVGLYKFSAFLFAGGCAGLAGCIWVLSLGRVGSAGFSPSLSILYVAAVLLGGPGPVTGSLAPAAGLAVFPILAGGLGKYTALIGPLAILVNVTTLPGGVNELNRRIHDGIVRVLHRSARRGGAVEKGET